MDRGYRWATVLRLQRVRHNWVTEDACKIVLISSKDEASKSRRKKIRILCLWHCGKKGERTQDFQRNWDQETWRSVRRVKDDRNLVTKELKVGGIHGSPPGWWVGRGERQCKTPKERAEETLRLVFWNFTPSLTVLLNRKDKKESHTKLGTEVGVNQLLRLGVILNNMLFCVLTWTKPKKKNLCYSSVFSTYWLL